MTGTARGCRTGKDITSLFRARGRHNFVISGHGEVIFDHCIEFSGRVLIWQIKRYSWRLVRLMNYDWAIVFVTGPNIATSTKKKENIYTFKKKKVFFSNFLLDVLKIGTCGVLDRAVDSYTRYNRYTCRWWCYAQIIKRRGVTIHNLPVE